MTGEAIVGWAFLVARGRQVGYHLLLAPEFVMANRESGLLMDEVRGEVPPQAPPRVSEITGPVSGRLCVAHRTIRATRADAGAGGRPEAPLLDRAGRPLVLAYGFVCHGARVAADEQDLRAALDAAVATYRKFHAAEEEFLPEASRPYALRSAVAPAAVPAPRPAAASPAMTARTAPWTPQIMPDPQRPAPSRPASSRAAPSRAAPSRPAPSRPASSRRRQSAIMLAVIGVLALAGLAAAGMSMFAAAGRVDVPNVVGEKSAAAVRQITRAGLVPEIERASTDRPCGIVVASRPKAHAQVDSRSKVHLLVSAGPPAPASIGVGCPGQAPHP